MAFRHGTAIDPHYKSCKLTDVGSNSAKKLMAQSFAEANRIRNCQSCKSRLSAVFKIPEFWWSSWYRRLNGYFGREATTGEDGILDGYSM